jgi:hypothetical protein
LAVASCLSMPRWRKRGRYWEFPGPLPFIDGAKRIASLLITGDVSDIAAAKLSLFDPFAE